jgi:hypothetical protein
MLNVISGIYFIFSKILNPPYKYVSFNDMPETKLRLNVFILRATK